MKLASGVTVSGAWGQGEDHEGAVAMVDPSFFQITAGYVFGESSVGVSWYQSSDFLREGSELTAIGAGVNHNLPKVNANVYAATQMYGVEDGDIETDDTVVMIGTLVRF